SDAEPFGDSGSSVLYRKGQCPASEPRRVGGCSFCSCQLQARQTGQVILCLGRDGRGTCEVLEGAGELRGDAARQPETDESVVVRGPSAFLEDLARAAIDHVDGDLAAAQLPAARRQTVE